MKLLRPLLILLTLGLARLSAQTYTFSNTSYFGTAGGIAIDRMGVVYLTNTYSNAIDKLGALGTGTLVAGRYSYSGSNDGSVLDARFSQPRGLAIDPAGNLYVADSGNHTIRKIATNGTVTTLAGTAGQSGAADGTGAAARFSSPQGLALDAQGNVYVADTGNSAIRKITATGVVTTYAGKLGVAGVADGSDARFDQPQGVAIDSAGNVYVADTNNHSIRQISPAGVVTTFAGWSSNRGELDGKGAEARFSSPQALTFDKSGNLYVADTGNYTIRKITPAGVVTTIGGLANSSGSSAGTAANARFYNVRSIAIDATGSLYIGDAYALRLGVTSSQLAFTVQPVPASVGAGSPAVFNVTATGDGPLSYQWQKDGSRITGATNAALVIASVQASDSGTYSVTATNLVGTLTSNSAVLTVLAANPNDSFANAQVISDTTGSVSGNNNGATGEPGEPTHVWSAATASSVWFKWTAPQSGTMVIDFGTGSYSFADAVYSGSSLSTLVRVAQSYGGRLSFNAESGKTYSIAVGSPTPTARGAFTLRWRMILNDNFAQAQAISGPNGQVNGSNDAATGESGEPNHMAGSSASTTSVWYRWTPSQSGTAVFQMAPTGFTPVLVLYTGDSLSALNAVAPGAMLLSNGRYVANVTAGTTYSIAVGSYGYGSGPFALTWDTSLVPVITQNPSGASALAGTSASLSVVAVSSSTAYYQWYKNASAIAGATNATYTIASATSADAGTYSVVVSNAAGATTSTNATVSVAVPPNNDNFASAQAIFGLTGSLTSTNANATGEPGEPIHWNLNGTATSVWFRWAPQSSGLAIVDTVGSTFDTVLAVYTGSSLTNLTRLTQDDDRGGGRTSQVTFAASAGTTYWIAVGGGSGQRGAFTLNWQLSPTLAIATQPISTTVVAGGTATFTVQATGSGVTYQWMRNGVTIPGATTASLVVDSIQGGTDASYTVTVSNSSGSVTSAPATLSVAAPMMTKFTRRNTRNDGGMLWSMAAGNGVMVAVGMGGEILSSADNGATWIPRNSGSTLWLVGVTFGAGQFVIVGEAGTILTSPDGVTWTPAPSPGTTERINAVIYADNKFVAVGEHGVILTSVDARTWTVRSSGVRTWLHGLTYNAKIGYFATDGEAGVVLISPDAVTWTLLPVDGVKAYLEAIVATDSYSEFVAVGHHETTNEAVCVSIHQNHLRLQTGEMITTWSSEKNDIGTKDGLSALTVGAGALFATGTSGKIISAKDGRGPWYTLPSETDDILLAALFFNDTLYVVGGHETVLQSEVLYRTRLVNISTRGQVGTGSNIMISGFVVSGSKPKQVLVRAAGPALGAAPFNLSGVLAQPVLTVVDEHNQSLGTNSGWSTAANATAIATTTAKVGAFPFGATSADSALLLTLSPGQYTAQVSGAGNTTGLGIVEVYDADALANDSARTINISTRGVTGSGANVMIAGFIVNGAASRRVLIRAVGPALTGFGVAGAASEPQLSLYNARGLLTATADSWGLQSNADEIRSATKAVGAFALPEGSKDSAMLVTLLPGAWTVQVNTANNTPGVALIEVYDVP